MMDNHEGTITGLPGACQIDVHCIPPNGGVCLLSSALIMQLSHRQMFWHVWFVPNTHLSQHIRYSAQHTLNYKSKSVLALFSHSVTFCPVAFYFCWYSVIKQIHKVLSEPSFTWRDYYEMFNSVILLHIHAFLAAAAAGLPCCFYEKLGSVYKCK